ncbi:MAG: Gfo/Idh/MocA family protein [Desulfovibrio sp.]
MTLRVGVVGLGVGESHVAAFDAHPDCRVTTICDLSPETLAAVLARHPGKTAVTDAEAVLDDPDIDVVCIASYDDTHYSQIRRALLHGKHVLAEKPLCLHEYETAEIRDILKANPGLRLTSNLSLRTCPLFTEVRQAAAAGRFGRLFYLEADYLWGRRHKLENGWRGRMPFYSIIHGAGVHMVDLCLWLTGRRPVRVRAWGSGLACAPGTCAFDDFALLALEFSDGLMVKITANGGCVHPHFHRLAVFGSEGTFLHEPGAQTWIGREGRTCRETGTDVYPARERRPELVFSFVDSIVDPGRPALVSEDDVFAAMSVCHAAERSRREGGEVPVAYV